MTPGTSVLAEAVENVSDYVGPMGFLVSLDSLETVPLKLNLHAAYEGKCTKRVAFLKHHCVLYCIGNYLLAFGCNRTILSSFAAIPGAGGKCCH